MAEIASGLAVEAVKSAGKRITRQFSYLKDFTRNINNLKDEAVKLDDEIRGLQLRVTTATEAGLVILPAVNTWLTNSNGIKAEINRILSEAENVGSASGCSKLRARFSLSKRAKKATDRSKEHRGELNFDPISQAGPPAAAQTVPEEKTLDFESRKDIEEAIMTTLRGGVANLIGIYGMGGLGKTTMAQGIRNRVLHENLFEEVAIAAVSQKVETSKIQVEIGGQLGLDLKDVTSLDARLKLHARLSGTKRNLVILDDVWKPLKPKDLGIPCDSQGSRCTILMTSRNKDTLDQMSVQKIFEMKVLSEDEAWLLFGEKADISDESEANLISIAKQVMKECGGLPLALTAIGVTLTGEKDLSIWKDTLVRLTKVCENIPVYGPLKLSYDFLQSEEAKPLFLLCCLFKEDADISLEYLTYFCNGYLGRSKK